MSLPRTLGELRYSPFSEERLRVRRVKDELRENLSLRLHQDGDAAVFPGIVGYDDTVVPQIVNAILYVLRTGCQWRMLPHDFPPWQIVYAYFRTWRLDGTWQTIHDRLRRKVRRAAIADGASCSV